MEGGKVIANLFYVLAGPCVDQPTFFATSMERVSSISNMH